MKFPEIWIFEPFEKEWRAASGIGGCRCLAWRLFFGIGFDTIIHLCYSTQCSCTKIVHLDIETRAAEPLIIYVFLLNLAPLLFL